MSQSSQGSEPRTPSKAMSVAAPSFYPGPLPDESALDSGLLEALSTVDNLEFDYPDNTSIGSSIGGGGSTGGGGGGGGFSSSSLLGQFSNNGSEPVSIPGTQDLRQSSFTSQHSHSPTSPSLQQGPNSSYYINQVCFGVSPFVCFYYCYIDDSVYGHSKIFDLFKNHSRVNCFVSFTKVRDKKLIQFLSDRFP